MEDGTPRRLEYMALDALQPHPDNPKAHDEAGISDSMGRFGVIDIIVLDDRTEQLISGHGRVDSFRRLRDAGESAPEGVTVAPDGTWTVPVVRGWASRDDDEAGAALIGLNQGTIAGGWVPDKLAMMLSDLQSQPGGLAGTFFSPDDVDSLLADLGVGETGIGDTDAAYAEGQPPPTYEPGIRAVQGLHEVGLFYGAEHYREFERLMITLRDRWGEDARPMLVLRALRFAEAGADPGPVAPDPDEAAAEPEPAPAP